VKFDSKSQFFSCYVIHYTPLVERRQFLEKALSEIEVNWVTEKNVSVENYPWRNTNYVFGVSKRLIAADLGINARSLSRTRRRARFESYLYRYASLLGSNFEETTYGSLPRYKRLPQRILELNSMHLNALMLFLQENHEWALLLEDDAVFSQDGISQVQMISQEKRKGAVWINLNDGAGLKRTASEKRINKNGLFRVTPPTTRCASAYMFNRKYAKNMNDLIEVHGLPDWLPIDVIFQVANRKIKAESYWSEPAKFVQGSESGFYKSNFKSLRES